MWRSILAIVLLPSFTAAQSAQVAVTPSLQSGVPTPTVPVRVRAPRPPYQSYVAYDGIRQGTVEDVAIQVLPGAFFTTPTSPVSGIVPLNLELQPAEGFTVTKLRYPKARSQKFTFQSNPLKVATTEAIRFKLRADPNTTLGPRTLTGKLTFQPIHVDSGIGSVQQVDITIPITVVEHAASVHKTGYPYRQMPVAEEVVLIIVLTPVMLAIMPVYLICMNMGKCD